MRRETGMDGEGGEGERFYLRGYLGVIIMIKYFFAHKYTSVWREGERGREKPPRGEAHPKPRSRVAPR